MIIPCNYSLRMTVTSGSDVWIKTVYTDGLGVARTSKVRSSGAIPVEVLPVSPSGFNTISSIIIENKDDDTQVAVLTIAPAPINAGLAATIDASGAAIWYSISLPSEEFIQYTLGGGWGSVGVLTNIQGVTGIQGIQGLVGGTGIQGIQGQTGIHGVPGGTGIQGVTGVAP